MRTEYLERRHQPDSGNEAGDLRGDLRASGNHRPGRLHLQRLVHRSYRGTQVTAITKVTTPANHILYSQMTYGSTRYVCSDGYCGEKTPCHRTVQEAADAAGTGTLIKIAGERHNGKFSLNADKDLTLQGGWGTTFNNPNGWTTTLMGTPKAPQGSLTFQNLKIVP